MAQIQSSQGRVSAPPLETMTAEQRGLYDAVIKGMGAPIGPRVPLLHDPELLQAWSRQGAVLDKALPRRLRELTILCVGQYWNSQFEWYAHEPLAVKEGIEPEVIESLRAGQAPRFGRQDEAIVYAYCAELQRTHRVSTATYQAARGLLGDKGLVDLTALIGHYTSVAMTLAAHEVPLPAGTEPPLPPAP